MHECLCFFPDGTVEIQEHEGVKNLWPVNTLMTRLWMNADGSKEVTGLMKKQSPVQWALTSYTQLSDIHRTMLFLSSINLGNYYRASTEYS